METPRKLEEIFEDFNKLKVLIIGDVMIDSYISGIVERVSPEAPVLVVLVNNKDNRLGGAANVARNILALGATPILCSAIGMDANGKMFLNLLRKKNLSTEGIIQLKNHRTTVKTRIMASKHQIVRIDEEDEKGLATSERNRLMVKIRALVEGGIDVIIFEDYDKGTIDSELIKRVTKLARDKGIPTAVDPKKKNFNDYRNVSLFKPNLKELNEGMNMNVTKTDLAKLSNAAKKLHEERNIRMMLITLSEAGVYVSSGNKQDIFPAHARSIVDVSGAGDTVISVAALAMALGLDSDTLAKLANLAGGLVCEQVGVVPIDKKRLLEEAKLMGILK